MAVTATGTHGAGSKSRFIAQWMVVLVTMAISYIAISRLVPASPSPVHARDASADEVAAHCNEFIALARAKYADDWKVRLDPGDTLCAPQIQAEWERQSAERKPRAPDASTPTFVEDRTATVPDSEASIDGNAARARNPETYCLNMMSLARTRYGAGWKGRLKPDDVAGCEDALARAAD
jgi:hypothetical protein